MDLSDDDDFDLPSSNFSSSSSNNNNYNSSSSSSNSKYRGRSSLIKTQAQLDKERYEQQQNYENKARSQHQERKRLMREVFNRRLEDFKTREEFEKYDEEREIIIWSKIKGFDRWQYNTKTDPETWIDLPIVDMKLLSRSKRKKASGSANAIKQTLAGGRKVAHLGTMSWRADDSSNGRLRFISATDRIDAEIKKYKDVIQRNKNRLLEEERLIEAQIADEMIEMEQQLQAFEKYDRKTQSNLSKRMNAVTDENDETNKRRRYDVYMSSTMEREKWELFDSLKIYPLTSAINNGIGAPQINRHVSLLDD